MRLLAPGPLDLAVETGALTLQVHGGRVRQQQLVGADRIIASGSTATLLPGDDALLHEAATASLLNAGRGPLLVLIVSVDLVREHLSAATPGSGSPISPLDVALAPGPASVAVSTPMPTPQDSSPAPNNLVFHGAVGENPRAFLHAMTELQYGRGQPLPADVGRLQSLVTSATPMASSRLPTNDAALDP